MNTLTVACHESCSSCLFASLMILGILLSVFGTAIFTSHLVIWGSLVLGSLSVCAWLKTKVPSEALVLYFVVSVLRSTLFLLSCATHTLASHVLQVALLLKIGVAPFQFWVYKVLKPLSVGSLCFFVGPLKFGALWLLVSLHSSALPLYFASLLLGLVLLWKTSSINLVLYASGACQLLILVLLGPSLFVPFFLIYLLALLGVALTQIHKISYLLAFLGLSGLPPLSMFWAKILALSCFPLCWSCLLILSSLLSLFPYLTCALSSSSESHSSIVVLSFLALFPCFLTFSFL